MKASSCNCHRANPECATLEVVAGSEEDMGQSHPADENSAVGTIDALEQHFSPKEVADRWRIDESTVRRLFQDEPGVFKIGKSGRRDGKRDYVTLRIPASVLSRVHRRRCGERK